MTIGRLVRDLFPRVSRTMNFSRRGRQLAGNVSGRGADFEGGEGGGEGPGGGDGAWQTHAFIGTIEVLEDDLDMTTTAGTAIRDRQGETKDPSNKNKNLQSLMREVIPSLPH